MPAIRRAALIAPIYHKIKGILPRVSATEQEALNAGTIGFDAELFSGQPDWAKLLAVPPITLTEEEKAFLDGPTNELCRMINDWDDPPQRREVPEEVWSFVKKQGFLGMLISKEHGGLGFSRAGAVAGGGQDRARARPMRASPSWCRTRSGRASCSRNTARPSRSTTICRASPRGWKCRASRSPGRRSGRTRRACATSAYVTRGQHQGKKTLGVRLSWDKRYITLAPVATLVGLAFHLHDPENLLGRGEDIGITRGADSGRSSRASRSAAGISLRRSAFLNGPIGATTSSSRWTW